MFSHTLARSCSSRFRCIPGLMLALLLPACASAPPPKPAEEATPTGPPPRLGDDEMKEARLNVQKVAGIWLIGVDGGGYGESWDNCASQLQNAVGRGKWEAGVASARTPFGTLTRRHFVKTHYTNKLQPPGHYIQVRYHSLFEKGPAKEVVTVVKEPDNQWRVVMYAIRATKEPPPEAPIPEGATPEGADTGTDDEGAEDDEGAGAAQP